MDRALLKKSLDEWQHFYLHTRKEMLPRPVPPLPGKNMGAALVGLRRSGKTFQAIAMTQSVPDQQVLYYNFEDPLFYAHSSVLDLEALLSVATEFAKGPLEVLIFDEIQNVEGWPRFIRKLIDQKQFRVILTGSSSKLLSREIAAAVAGRCLAYNVWPLSLDEVMSFQADIKHADARRSLRQILDWGSLPEVILTKEKETKEKILKQYLSDIVLKDVVSRFEIRNKRALDQIMTYYLTNPSSLHSYSALKKAFGVNTDTASQYTEALHDAFMVFEVNRYHPNLKVQARDPKKVYIIDAGFRRVGARSLQDDTGKLLENLVFVELLRREREVTYFKGRYEVDFVLTEKYQPQEAIQVCASNLENADTRKREIQALLECLQTLGLSRGTVVTLDREERFKEVTKRIDFIPAWKWLSHSHEK